MKIARWPIILLLCSFGAWAEELEPVEVIDGVLERVS